MMCEHVAQGFWDLNCHPCGEHKGHAAGLAEGRRLERERVTEAGAPKTPGERMAYLAGERDGRRAEREAVVAEIQRMVDEATANEDARLYWRAAIAAIEGDPEQKRGDHVAGDKVKP